MKNEMVPENSYYKKYMESILENISDSERP